MDEPAWPAFLSKLDDFLGTEEQARTGSDDLSPRELEVLAKRRSRLGRGFRFQFDPSHDQVEPSANLVEIVPRSLEGRSQFGERLMDQ